MNLMTAVTNPLSAPKEKLPAHLKRLEAESIEIMSYVALSSGGTLVMSQAPRVRPDVALARRKSPMAVPLANRQTPTARRTSRQSCC